MFGNLAKTLFGSENDRVLKRLAPRVAAINALEPDMEALDDTALAAKTAEFRDRLAAGATLDDLWRKLSRRFARPPNAPSVSAILTSS